MVRIFLLSPAYAGGQRAQMMMSERAQFALARRLRSNDDRPTLGEVFTFLSGLYFRGKLAYAKAFATGGGAFFITPNSRLLPVDHPIGVADLRGFGAVDIHEDDPRYTKPLQRDEKKMKKLLPHDAQVV